MERKGEGVDALRPVNREESYYQEGGGETDRQAGKQMNTHRMSGLIEANEHLLNNPHEAIQLQKL